MIEGTGVKEKTIEDRIRDLANPDLCKSGDEAEEIINSLHHERAKIIASNHNENKKLLSEINQLRVEIKALTGYIAFKEL